MDSFRSFYSRIISIILAVSIFTFSGGFIGSTAESKGTKAATEVTEKKQNKDIQQKPDSLKEDDGNIEVETEVINPLDEETKDFEDSEEDSGSILSFNFIFYFLQKFKFPDFLKNSF